MSGGELATVTPKKRMYRQKEDIGWEHCNKIGEGRFVQIECKYCGKLSKGGGIYRFKEHLAGRKRAGPICLQVPPEVSLLMQQVLDGNQLNRSGRKSGRKKSAKAINGGEMVESFGSDQQPSTVMVTTTSGKRARKDAAWEYCQAVPHDKRVYIKCNYCGKLFKGGGIHRFKEHLAGVKSKDGVAMCEGAPSDVRILMQQVLSDISGNPSKRRKKPALDDGSADDGFPPGYADGFDGSHYTRSRANGMRKSVEADLNELFDQEEDGTLNGVVEVRKVGRGKSSTAPAGTMDALNALPLRKVDSAVHVTMGRFLYDIGANIDALDSVHFQAFIDVIAPPRSGIISPSNHDIRGWVLKKLVEEVKNDVEHFKTVWTRTGCSILVEERNTSSGKIILNFLASCSEGMLFLKSVDASSIIYSAESLCELFNQIMEEVGPGHVLQVITNGEEHYVTAGKMLMDTFPSLYWAPCSVHCIEQILDDFGKVDWIKAVLEQAKSVTRFVYNHGPVLNLMKKFTSGRDIVQQGVTRSATNFTTLERMADFKLSLQSMVTSEEWMECMYSKQLGGLAMLDTISNRSFWSSCIMIIRLTNPLLRLLRIVSSKKRSAMGYVFAGIYRAKEAIKKALLKTEDYMVYWDIIDKRWEQQRLLPLHATGFFFNPKFFYSLEEEIHNDIQSKVLDSIERLVPDVEVQDKIVKELNLYKNAVGDLGRNMAIRARETLLPVEWWSTYGGGCPSLSRLAIRVLNQACSSLGCEHNHIPFEKLHDSRNYLERQRLSDIVFVQYNLRLKQMVDGNKKSSALDPISFDNISLVEDWILQNELCLEDYGNLDWMSLVPSSAATTTTLGASVDETDNSTSDLSADDLASGFDDPEIFNSLKCDPRVEELK